MKRLLISIVIVGMLISAGGCDWEDTPPMKTTVYTNTYEERRSPAEEAKRVKEKNRLKVERREKEWKREEKSDYVLPTDVYTKIRLFLLSHTEFGSFRNPHNASLIGTIPRGITVYDITLVSGRKLQFWFKAGSIYLVGEEINDGFIAHYGRM